MNRVPPHQVQAIARGPRALAQSYANVGMTREAARAERDATALHAGDRQYDLLDAGVLNRVPAWALALGGMIVGAVLVAGGMLLTWWGETR